MADGTPPPQEAQAQGRRAEPSDRYERYLDEPPRRHESEDSLGVYGWATVVGIAALIGGFFVLWLKPGAPDPLDYSVVKFERDEILRHVVWPSATGGGYVRGASRRETDWAVFFYKVCARKAKTSPPAPSTPPPLRPRVRSTSPPLPLPLRAALLRRVQARVARLPRPRRHHQRLERAALRRDRLRQGA